MNPTNGTAAASPKRTRRAPGRTGRAVLALGLAAVVIVAGYATYAYLSSRPSPGEATLVVYTYASLFGGTCGGTDAFASVFGGFESAHHVRVEVQCPSGTLATTLIDQRNAPGADLVIGLDEVTASQAAAAGVLVPYASPALSDVPTDLVSGLSPTHEVTPYEFGYLAVDYNDAFGRATGGAVATSNFTDFAANASWAKSLVVEDPTVDITGEEFLLWEIEYSTQVLHQNWTLFWQAADRNLQYAPDWTTAFDGFVPNGSQPQAVVSYSTDPAYAQFYASPSFNATVSHDRGQEYGWKTIYGVGIVNGSRNVALDRAFIDYFLSGTVQAEIPTNEWEYPANSTVPLPSSYQYALNASQIHALNDGTTPSQIHQNLGTWLDEWQSVENQYG